MDGEHKGVRLFLLVVAFVCERTTCRVSVDLSPRGDGILQSRMFYVTCMADLSYNVLHGPLSSMTRGSTLEAKSLTRLGKSI